MKRTPRTPAQRAGGIDGQVAGWNNNGRSASDAFMTRPELAESDCRQYGDAYYEGYARALTMREAQS